MPAAAQTVAGTSIVNVARADYIVGDTPQSATSNTDTLLTAERLDVTLVPATPAPAPLVAGTSALPFTLTNTGNGTEAFVVAGTIAGTGTTLTTIVTDTDGDGRYDPASDTALADGTTPPLAPGATLALLAIVLAQPDAQAGTLTLTARAATGSGQPGTAFAGRGDGSGDAVAGATGAAATATLPFAPAGDAPVLTKSQSIRAPDGSDTPAPGAVVTYVVTARFPAAAGPARIDDAIPAGTRYVADSLRLDDARLSDAADADAGSFDGAAIRVALGDIAAAATRTVQFQVTIQ